MSVLNITVGGDVMGEARRAFIDAWRLAESGDHFPERHHAFETWNTLIGIMTAERAELIGYVQRHEVTSLQQLAIGVGREVSAVNADVELLESKGFLDRKGGGIRAPFDTIEAKVTL